MVTRPANVLVVDDEPHVCRLIKDVLSSGEFQCTLAYSGEEAKQHLLQNDYDVVVLDLLLPDIAGVDVLKFISSQRLSTRVICITGVPSSQSSQAVLTAGACDFLEKPFDVSQLAESVRRAAADRRGASPDSPEREARDSDERLKQTLLESAGALVRAVEAKDPYTRRHSDHVAHYAENLARHAGAAEGLVESVRVAGLLHDIGKIAVPDSVLTKPGKLSRAEFDLVRQHPDVGAAILENITLLRPEAQLVRHHHENWDGSGYPAGLHGSEIPLGSRILNIADSIDAMLMHRTYKQPYSVEQMLKQLDCCAGGQFDPTLARQAIDWCRENPSMLILPTSSEQIKTA